jgi:hypothetical protein
VLNREERLRAYQADVAHMAYVEDADAVSNGIVLGNDPPAGGVLHRHIPAVKFDHFGAHAPMDGVQGSFADGRSRRLNSGQ